SAAQLWPERRRHRAHARGIHRVCGAGFRGAPGDRSAHRGGIDFISHSKGSGESTGGELPAAERQMVDASVAALQEAARGSDYKLIRRQIDELNHATEHLAELLMTSAVQTALEGKKLAEV